MNRLIFRCAVDLYHVRLGRRRRRGQQPAAGRQDARCLGVARQSHAGGGTAVTVNDTTSTASTASFSPNSSRKSGCRAATATVAGKYQADWPKETAGADQFVQMAIVIRGRRSRSTATASCTRSTAQAATHAFGPNTAILFGPRHQQKSVDCFFGRIHDARVYAKPLDQATIAAMQPGKPVEQVEPWAWWDFAATGTYDRAGA